MTLNMVYGTQDGGGVKVAEHQLQVSLLVMGADQDSRPEAPTMPMLYINATRIKLTQTVISAVEPIKADGTLWIKLGSTATARALSCRVLTAEGVVGTMQLYVDGVKFCGKFDGTLQWAECYFAIYNPTSKTWTDYED